MQTILVRNVNDAWAKAKRLLNADGIERASRNGPVREYPTPVTTWYTHPTERVLFDTRRNCNPFFHLFEALWMLAGRNDVAWIERFNKRMRQFSDDGHTFRGAYGHRWRNTFNIDQLQEIIGMLRANKDDRRAVLQMWDCWKDLNKPNCLDLPCNTHCYFLVRRGRLSMTICCRSNDIVWGAYGANAVHFSILHEYMASQIGVPLGHMFQISNSWHAYKDRWEAYGGCNETPESDPYTSPPVVGVYRLVDNPDTFDIELVDWLKRAEETTEPTKPDLPQDMGIGYVLPCDNSFFTAVAQPLLNAWLAYKADDLPGAIAFAGACEGPDWRLGAERWLTRIQQSRQTGDTSAAQ